ncbi:hypothetical protein PsorP6_006676 [Peronosclerospora sorghi]|uniref:Uncharacterized protein n=1 Tax=Peronosclerospora sorghi TaxID=230839 RepID=A0ACC0W2B8_9STRA|nr:hypothetical protein PsorP6_006676 [Peronosclerospora sorghi]
MNLRLWSKHDVDGRCGERCPLLQEFTGGIATVFPCTSTVESDFSEITWHKDEYRSSLTDFSLEGILQCKQHLQLGEICHRL